MIGSRKARAATTAPTTISAAVMTSARRTTSAASGRRRRAAPRRERAPTRTGLHGPDRQSNAGPVKSAAKKVRESLASAGSSNRIAIGDADDEPCQQICDDQAGPPRGAPQKDRSADRPRSAASGPRRARSSALHDCDDTACHVLACRPNADRLRRVGEQPRLLRRELRNQRVRQ